MLRRILAIGAILLGASCAWGILAGTLTQRTTDSDTDQRAALGTLWGTDQTQSVPCFYYDVEVPAPAGSHKAPTTRTTGTSPDASAIRVNLALDQRRKGLLWYNTYAVAFASEYKVRNPGPSGLLRVEMPFAATAATFDDVIVSIDGRPVATRTGEGGLLASTPISARATSDVRIAYRSHGVGTWTYRFGTDAAGVRNFTLDMDTNFKAIDFPQQTLSPTSERETGQGWHLTWSYSDLITGYGIGMTFPSRLQPGPLATRITVWAPVALLFYFFVLVIVTTLRKIDLHPVNYFFLAAAFFAFHLLFAYTVDRISIWQAFALSSAVSMFLTISYLRLVAGLRFAAVEAALAQFFYLILFSLALFNEGFSGISITIGAIVTLFLSMQWTGRIRWSERLATPPSSPPAPSTARA
jgi:hypothetical protein